MNDKKKAAQATGGGTDFEWAKLLYDEWKFRQAHLWRLLGFYGIAAVFVSIGPYLLEDIRGAIGYWALAFPVYGLIVAGVVLWLFRREYEQMSPILTAYRALKHDANLKYEGTDPKLKGKTPIGKMVPKVFFWVFLLGSVMNAFLLIASIGIAQRHAEDIGQQRAQSSENAAAISVEEGVGGDD